ncbi:hypothetical protein B0H11DRAFT_882654 [Mycena galericulata]|nr:hypothetical protein B0H11DRAFT_882654 [Mycena galericulata]
MMAVPPSAAPDVFRGSDESGIHWSTVDGEGWSHKCPPKQTFWSAPHPPYGDVAAIPSDQQPAASIRRRFLKTSRLSSHVMDSLTSRLTASRRPQDFKTSRLSDPSTLGQAPLFGFLDARTARSSRLSALGRSLFDALGSLDAWCLDRFHSPSIASGRAVFVPSTPRCSLPRLASPLLALDRRRPAAPSLRPRHLSHPSTVNRHASSRRFRLLGSLAYLLVVYLQHI